jgi:hypothetical protein
LTEKIRYDAPRHVIGGALNGSETSYGAPGQAQDTQVLLISFGWISYIVAHICDSGILSLSWIHEGHIKANVPEQDRFSITLTRDLNRYFSDKLASQVDVKYQLLRDQPTQAGLAFPKFYAWVTVLSRQSGTKIEEGAVKFAARDKVSFSVTDFVSVDDIKTHHDDLKKIFPSDILGKIQNRP